jgi:hypothetical protein
MTIGLIYKTFLFDETTFFNYPMREDDTLTITPFKTRTPDFTGVATDFQNYNDTAANFATYQCTSANTNGFVYFNISLQGSLYTGTRAGVYEFVFTQYGLNNDDLTYFYFGENAQNPTTTNYDQATTFNSGGDNSFTTPFLEPDTYYPILLYYGQSFGGANLALGLISPGDEIPDYSPASFTPTWIDTNCPANKNFIPINNGSRSTCVQRDIYRPIVNTRSNCRQRDSFRPILRTPDHYFSFNRSL